MPHRRGQGSYRLRNTELAAEHQAKRHVVSSETVTCSAPASMTRSVVWMGSNGIGDQLAVPPAFPRVGHTMAIAMRMLDTLVFHLCCQ